MAKGLKENVNYLREVRNQYENYPFPSRDPEAEKKGLSITYNENLDLLNYYCFSGKQSFNNGFRSLVAGAGTGDAVIALSEQLREKDAKVVYLDLSESSMNVAKKRAEIRGLNNIEWIQGSILDLPKLGLEKFDYINCSGVLHHLDSTEDGLTALTSVLKDDGAMLIMLYAKYGRTAIYHMQDMMRIVNKNENDMQNKVENCKSILNELPESNWFKSYKEKFSELESKDFIDKDAGIYDMFLHSTDRAFSIPELYEILDKEKLKLLYLDYDKHPLGNNLYNIESYIKDKQTLEKIRKLPDRDQQAIIEILNGKIFKHTFYTSKENKPIPTIDDLGNVPALSIIMNEGSYKNIYDIVRGVEIGGEINIQCYEYQIQMSKQKYMESIFKYLDGERSIREIFDCIISDASSESEKPNIEELKTNFKYIFNTFSLVNWMLLRSKEVPKFKSFYKLQKRVTDMHSSEQPTLFSLDMK